jgi:hypothetical protein
MERREILGSVVFTSSSGPVLSTDMSIVAVDASTFPSGSSGKPFVIVLNRGTPLEEKVLCSSRASNTFTVSQRGYDGTTANNHANGVKIDHVLDATAMDDMNDVVYDTQIMYWMEAS